MIRKGYQFENMWIISADVAFQSYMQAVQLRLCSYTGDQVSLTNAPNLTFLSLGF